jgi:hypothetical protein
MAKLKDWLDGDDEQIGAGVKGSTGGAAAAGEAEAPAAEMEQLQVAEEVRAAGAGMCVPALFSGSPMC